jgi:hypothetical protein
MRVIYGKEGAPAGSVDGQEIYDRDGSQIGVLEGDHIYSALDGDWVGSYTFGVVRNVVGDPVGFTKGCEDTIPPLPPTSRAMQPPKVKSLGSNVRDQGPEPVPIFLAHMSSLPTPPSYAGFFV